MRNPNFLNVLFTLSGIAYSKLFNLFRALFIFLLFILSFSSILVGQNSTPQHPNQEAEKVIEYKGAGFIPNIFFEQNKGQLDKDVHFRAVQGASSFYFGADGVQVDSKSQGKYDWNIKFMNTTMSSPTATHTNSTVVNDYSKPQKFEHIPNYKDILYSGIYEGIDLKYYENKDHLLEYDYIVHPNSDVNNIRFALHGVEQIAITEKQELKFNTIDGEILNAKPYAYQIVNHQQKEVEVIYALHGNEVGFEVKGDYDPNLTLVIDPMVLTYTATLDYGYGKIYQKNLYYYTKLGFLKGIGRDGNVLFSNTLPANIYQSNIRIENGIIYTTFTNYNTDMTINGTFVPRGSTYFGKFNAFNGTLINGFAIKVDSYAFSKNKLYALTNDSVPSAGAAFPTKGTNSSFLSIMDTNGIFLAGTFLPSGNEIFYVDDQKVYFTDVNNEYGITYGKVMSLTCDAKTFKSSTTPLNIAYNYSFESALSQLSYVNNVITVNYEHTVVSSDPYEIITDYIVTTLDSNLILISQSTNLPISNPIIDPYADLQYSPGTYNNKNFDTLANEVASVSFKTVTESVYNPITCTFSTTTTQLPGLHIACFNKTTNELKNEFIFKEVPILYNSDRRIHDVKFDSSGKINIVFSVTNMHDNLNCALPFNALASGKHFYYLRVKCDGRVDYFTEIEDRISLTSTFEIVTEGTDVFLIYDRCPLNVDMIQTPNHFNDYYPNNGDAIKRVILHFKEPATTGLNTVQPPNQTVCKKQKVETIYDKDCTITYANPHSTLLYQGINSRPYESCDSIMRKCIQWQKSIDNINWMDIPGATDTSYTPDPLSVTTYFRRKIFENISNVHTVNVLQFDIPKVTMEPISFCPGQSVQFNTVVTGNGAFTYIWTPSAGLNNPNIPNPTLTPTATGSYKVVVTDANGCKAEAFQAVKLLTVNAGDDKTVCNGTNAQLAGTINIQGGGPFTFAWTVVSGDMASIISGANTLQPTVKPNVTTTYRLTVNGPNSCVLMDDVVIKVQNPATFNNPSMLTLCPGSTPTLFTNPGNCYNISWTPGGLDWVGTELKYKGATQSCGNIRYIINAEDKGNVCPNAKDTIDIHLLQLPSNSNCNPNTGTFTLGLPDSCSGNTYNWTVLSGDMSSIPSGTSTNPQITVTPNVATVYKVTVSKNGVTCTTNLSANPCGTSTCIDTTYTLRFCNPILPDTFNISYSFSDTTKFNRVLASADPVFNTSLFPKIVLNSTFSGKKVITVNYVNKITGAISCTDKFDIYTDVIPFNTIVFNKTLGCNANGDLIGEVIGGTSEAGYTYFWVMVPDSTALDNRNILNATASKAGFYRLVVTHIATGCKKSYEVEVKTKQPIYEGIPVNICASETAGVQLGLPSIPNTSYTWTPGTNLNNTNTAQPVFTPTVVDSFFYSVKVTDNTTHCFVLDTIIVRVLPIVVDAGSDVTICDLPTAKGTIGTPPVVGTDYSWSPTTGLSNANIANPTFTNAAVSGIYTVTATVGDCSATDVVVITKTAPTVTNQNLPDVVICETLAKNIGFPANPGMVYLWNQESEITDLTDPNPSIEVNANKTFVLTELDTTNCSKIIYTQNVKAVIKEELGGPPTVNVCRPGTAILGIASKPGYTYSWVPVTALDNATIAQPTVTPTTASVAYQLNYTYLGCAFVNNVSVKSELMPTANAGAPVDICPGASATIGAAATTGITYSWTPTSALSSATISKPVANPTSTTTYTVSATKGFCTNTAQVVVTVKELKVDMPTDYIACADPIKIGPAISPNTTYSWSPTTGLSNPNIAQPMADPANITYTLTATNTVSGCIKILTTKIKAATLPTLNLGEDLIACQNGCVTVNPVSISGFSTYSWAFSNDIESISSPTTKICPGEGGGTYKLTATTNDGCKVSDEVIVSISPKPAPLVNLGSNKLICLGNSIQLTTTDSSNYNYVWQEQKNNVWVTATSLNNPFIFDPIATPTVTTTYKLVVTNKVSGCISDSKIKIETQTLNISIPTTKALCLGSSYNFGTTVNSVPAANDSTLTYLWSPTTGLSSATVKNPTFTPSSNTSYKVKVSHSKSGCVSYSNLLDISVENATPTTINLPSNIFVCGTDSVTIPLSPVAANTYAWTGTGTYDIANPTLPAPDRTDNYALTVNNANNTVCAASATKYINLIKLKKPTLTLPVKYVCEGNTTPIQIGDSTINLNKFDIEWLTTTAMTNTSSKTPSVLPTSTITYQLKLTPKNKPDSIYLGGCDFIYEQKVIVVSPPIAYAGLDKSLCGSGSVKIGSGSVPGYQYTWKKGSDTISRVSNPLVTANASSDYDLIVVDSKGCVATDALRITVGQPNGLNISQQSASCPATLGKIVLNAVSTANKFAVSQGASFTGLSYDSATFIGTLPSDIQNNIPLAGGTYTFRFYNGNNSCYFDTTIVAALVSCVAPCVPPIGAFTITLPSCSSPAGLSNNDGSVKCTVSTTGMLPNGSVIYSVEKYGVSLGNTYTGPTYANANVVSSSTFDIQTSIPNTGGTYTIRLFNTELCTVDTTIVVDPQVCTIPGTLGNYVWYDTNNDGKQDSNEPKVKDAIIQLFRNGILVVNDTTDANGIYGFEYLDSASYHIKVVNSSLPTMWSISLKPNASGVNDSLDSDVNPTTMVSQDVIIDPTPTLGVSLKDNPTLDIGLRKLPMLTLNDPCSCWDINYRIRDSAELKEQLKVESGAGENWKIIAQTGMWVQDSSTKYLVPIPSPFVESSPGIYTLNYLIEQNIPYTVKLTNGFDTLTYGGVCTAKYPNVSITALDTTICYNSPPVPLVASTSNGTYSFYYINNANHSVTITEFDPKSFSIGQNVNIYLRTLPSDPNLCPSTKYQTINIKTIGCPVACVVPNATFTSTAPTCNAGTPNNDGKITLTAVNNADKYAISSGATFTGGSYAIASSVSNLPIVVQSGIPNTGGSYTIRVYNGSDTCFKDTNIVIALVTCIAPPPTCILPSAVVTQSAPTCSATGTANNDGKITLTAVANANKYGISAGATYTGASYATAASTTGLPLAIQTSIPNAGGSYTIRLFNGSATCFKDTTIMVSAVNCCPSSNNIQICPGEIFELSVTDITATGIQWYKNGIAITGANNLKYNATTVGTYTYTAQNTTGCSIDQCCPIVITANPNCCPPDKICKPVLVKINR